MLVKRVKDWFCRRLQIRVSLASLFLALALGLLVVNGLLLKRTAALERALHLRAAAMEPQLGTTVPPLEGVGRDGSPLKVEYSHDKRRVSSCLYFLRSVHSAN
jgi:hypothetical protein